MVSSTVLKIRHPLFHLHRLPFDVLLLLSYALISFTFYLLVATVFLRFRQKCKFIEKPFVVLLIAKIPTDLLLILLSVIQIYIEYAFYHHIQLPQYRPSYKIFTCFVELIEHIVCQQCLSLIFCAFTTFTHERLIQVWTNTRIILVTIIQIVIAIFLDGPKLLKFCYNSTPDVFVLHAARLEDSKGKDVLESSSLLILCGFLSMMTVYSREKNRQLIIYDRNNSKDFRVLVSILIGFIFHVGRQFVSDSTRDSVKEIHDFSSNYRCHTLIIFSSITPWALITFHKTIRKRIFDITCLNQVLSISLKKKNSTKILIYEDEIDKCFSLYGRPDDPVAL
ncbi:unnamed protein product, partial [Mesorhabditis belari]|uniref:Uncharacterized protein n=1 Tax=Mesorhabditis belari TaxID=2138241 RepID=A0AAF3EVX7_9BILA